MSSPDATGVTNSIANLSLVATEDPFQDPQAGPEDVDEQQITPRQTQFATPLVQPEPHNSRRESSEGSDTETERPPSTTAKMPSGSSSSSKHHHQHSSSSSSSKKHSSSGSSSKHHSSSSSSKKDDWSDVTDPEERRRIQNRIAQRKFREKTRDTKERQDREARNQQLAGSSYQIPSADDLQGGQGQGYGGEDLSGLPWGGLNIPHMVARGHASASQQGSQPQQHQQQQQMGGGDYYDPQLQMWISAGGGVDDRYFDTSASSSSPSYFSYDAFSGDGGSQ